MISREEEQMDLLSDITAEIVTGAADSSYVTIRSPSDMKTSVKVTVTSLEIHKTKAVLHPASKQELQED